MVHHQVTLDERKKQIAEHRANPEYVAMLERVAKRFAEIDRVRGYALRN